MVVAAGQEGRSGWRAQRCRVPLRVHQAVVGELLQGRHIDAATERRPSGKACIVVKNDENVWRTVCSLLRRERIPIRFRVADVEVDDTLEALLLQHRLGRSARGRSGLGSCGRHHTGTRSGEGSRCTKRRSPEKNASPRKYQPIDGLVLSRVVALVRTATIYAFAGR